MKTCCVTGHRPSKFPWNYYDYECRYHTDYLVAMAAKVVELINDNFTHFICGGAHGVDLDFADVVIGLRDTYCPQIELEVAIPYDSQSSAWCDEDRERYAKVLSLADTITYIRHEYSPDCIMRRNRYMVDKSDLLLAFWNGTLSGGTWNAIQYAKMQGKALSVNVEPSIPTYKC